MTTEIPYQVKSGRQVNHEIASEDHPEGETTLVHVGLDVHGLLSSAPCMALCNCATVSWEHLELKWCALVICSQKTSSRFGPVKGSARMSAK